MKRNVGINAANDEPPGESVTVASKTAGGAFSVRGASGVEIETTADLTSRLARAARDAHTELSRWHGQVTFDP